MTLYKEMSVNKAATYAISSIQDTNSLTSIDKLKLSLIVNKNVAMYKDIYTKSIETQEIFLTTLSTEKNKNKSIFSPLFLAEVYILQGKLKEAEDQLLLYKKSNNALSAVVNITVAWLENLKNNENNYNNIVSKMDLADPLTAMALDAIKIITTGKSSIDLNIIRTAEKQYIDTNNINSNRFSNYALRIYSHRNELNDARRIFIKLDQKKPSFVEEITQFKLINFYEPSLIDSIYSYYYTLAKSLLTDLKKDAKYHDMAIYYLSDLELISANKSSSKHFKEAMLNLTRLPKSLASLRTIRQNGHAYLYGKTTRAHQAWEKAVNNAKNNPAVGAEAILMCLYLEASCPTIVQTARLKAENGRSKRFENLNTNVGRYFLLRKENNKAVRLLENALNRSNADGILMNDPILLLNLAEIYRLEKRFSESLQIYFSLGQNFPILRQVQDAVQGEYLFRQRSNGSNTVF